jgi:hypothetical protein
MIYAIIGTNPKKREEARREMTKLGTAASHIYGENVRDLESFLEASSLFGGTIIVDCISLLEGGASKEEAVRLLPRMKDSGTIFIVDEPFAVATTITLLTQYTEKVFDCREEKERDLDPFLLCTAFAKRDKKTAWVEWMKIRDELQAEAIQGALWWKFQIIWQDTKNGKPSKFTLDECEAIGERLVKSSILAHRGEKDLKVELECLILSL